MSLKKYAVLFFLLCSSLLDARHKKTIIILDPAGDSAQPGRKIDDQFERTIAFQCAQALKRKLEQQCKNTEIFFSRLPGEQRNQQEKARFANQLFADLYISLHFYQTLQLRPQIHLYYYDSYETIREPLHTPILFDKAHCVNQAKTREYALTYMHELQNLAANKYEVHQPIGYPCLPCKGIIAPALCIEIGLKSADDWTCCSEPLLQGLIRLCKIAPMQYAF